MKFTTHALLCVLVLSLASCARPGPPSEAMDLAQVRQALEAANAKFVEAFNRGDAAAVAALYTDDATLLPPSSDLIRGRQGLQDFWSAAMKAGLKDVALTTVDVWGSEDTACEIGKYSVTVQPEGQERRADSGKYLVVWKRQTDGSWKLQADIWNSNLPPQ